MTKSEKSISTKIWISRKSTIYAVVMTIGVTIMFSTLIGTSAVPVDTHLAYAQGETTTDTINASKIVNASRDEVWNIISDLDNNPDYWPVKIIDVISKTNNSVEREVTVPAPPFMNNKAFQTIEIIPGQYKVVENQTKGAVTGVKTISLNQIGTDSNKTEINIIWNLDLSNIPSIGQGFAKNGISNSVNDALDKIGKGLP